MNRHRRVIIELMIAVTVVGIMSAITVRVWRNPAGGTAAAEWLAGNPSLFAAACALLGLIVGSFLTVVIHRLPIMLRRDQDPARRERAAPEEAFNLARPPSRCPRCGNGIRPWRNVPVVSFALLRGRCADCGRPIGLHYPAVELLCGALSGLVALHFGVGWTAAAMLTLTWHLIALAFIDWRCRLLPDQLVLPLLWLGLVAAALGVGAGVAPADAVLGAAAGYLTLRGVGELYRLLAGREGMGHGDFKLLAALGAWTGWQGLLPLIALASLGGVLFGLAWAAVDGWDRNRPIPFGPFLAGAGFVSLLWGRQLTAAYAGAFGL